MPYRELGETTGGYRVKARWSKAGCQAGCLYERGSYTFRGYSFRRYIQCGTFPVVARIRLYGQPLVGPGEYNLVCEACLVDHKKRWKDIEVEPV